MDDGPSSCVQKETGLKSGSTDSTQIYALTVEIRHPPLRSPATTKTDGTGVGWWSVGADSCWCRHGSHQGAGMTAPRVQACQAWSSSRLVTWAPFGPANRLYIWACKGFM
ncbi:hypothetical protein V6N13_094379 [Hibiscus sabdariffa]